jgi:peptidoglycan hydrolase-like protein with peptidoglycan-binding domain
MILFLFAQGIFCATFHKKQLGKPAFLFLKPIKKRITILITEILDDVRGCLLPGRDRSVLFPHQYRIRRKSFCESYKFFPRWVFLGHDCKGQKPVHFIPFRGTVGASFDRDLHYGLQSDSQVNELQEFLAEQGLYSGPITGNFFSLTLQGVKDFQIKYGIEPAAGFFGPLTRAKANEVLVADVESSDQQALNETGSVPAPSEPAKTTNDVVSSLQAQISLLLQQISLLQMQTSALQATQQQVQQQTEVIQQQQQTINQIQQNTQQIVQNTSTPAPVVQEKPEQKVKIAKAKYIWVVREESGTYLHLLNEGDFTIRVDNIVLLDKDGNPAEKLEELLPIVIGGRTFHPGAQTNRPEHYQIKPGEKKSIRILRQSTNGLDMKGSEIIYKGIKYVPGSIINLETGEDIPFPDFYFEK